MSLIVAGPGGFVLGLLVFILLPFIGNAVGWGGPAKMMLILATMPIRRLAIVVSEHNDVIAEPMSFDALGFEWITIDGQKKAFEDPSNALHSWLGLPFAFADEESGVLFDPRDAAAGEQKATFDERNERAYNATDEEWDRHGIEKWVPGAFTLPDAHQLVDLSAAQQLVTGGERSEYPKRTEEFYKHSRDPYSDGMPMLRLFLPVIAFMASFGGIWLLASQLGVPGGGGGGSTVAFGGGLLVAAGTRKLQLSDIFGNGDDPDPLADPDEDATMRAIDDPDGDGSGGAGGSDGDDDPNWLVEHSGAIKGVLGILLGTALFTGYAVGMALLWGIFTAVVGVFALGAGFLCVPVLAQLGRLSAGIGSVFSSLFFKLGFASYRRPVLVWTPEEYELREYDELAETAPDPTWYSLFGARIGFSFDPGADSFGEAGVSSDRLDAYTPDVIADGGEADSNVPSVRYDRAPELGPDGYGGFVESDRDGYGVLTDIAMGWWSRSADGTKSNRQLGKAKEEFGGDAPPVSDKTIAYLTAAMGFVGAVPAVVLFVL